MKSAKLILAAFFLTIPSIGLAANGGGYPLHINENSQLESNPLVVKAPEILRVPSPEELQEMIDKNDTLIQKTPMQDYQMPLNTRKIVNKLPKNLEKVKKIPKGKENLNSSDFTGDAEISNASILQSDPKGSPKFELSFSKKDDSVAPEDLTMASKAYMVGQYESAIALYKKVLVKDTKNRDALFGLATSYHKNRQKDQAKVFYAKLLELYPYDSEGQNNFLALVGEEAPVDALNEFNTLEKNNPDYAPIYAHKAMIYMKIGDDKSAIKNFSRALSINSDNNDYKYDLAILFDKNGYYENANKLYGDLIEDNMRGEPIPVSRYEITERMNFLNNKIHPE